MSRRVQPFGLVKFVATPDVETGTQSRDRFGRGLAACNSVVSQHDVHEVVEIDAGLEALGAVPDIEAIAARRTRKVDVDVLLEHFRVCRIERISQAVQLRHLLKRCQQAEADDVEQRDGATRHIVNAELANHPLDDLGLYLVPNEWLAQTDIDRLDVQQP